MALEPLAGLVVVDLFAGSGALGIEALSRGAAEAHFVESHRDARTALAANLETLGLEARARVWSLTLPQGLGRLAAPLARADLVLLDPPYGEEPARGVLARLGEPGRLAAGCRVVLEHHARVVPGERVGRLVQERRRQYGETALTTFRVAAADANAGHDEEQR